VTSPRQRLGTRGHAWRWWLTGVILLLVGPAVAGCGAPAAGPAGGASASGAAKPGAGAGGPASGGVPASPSKPSTVAEIALYRGADREQVLSAGAHEEGKLVLYTSLTWMESVAREFEKKYPFVQVEFYRADSLDISERLTNEYKAGRYATDIVHTTPAAMELFREENLIQEFWTPELLHFPAEVRQPGPNGGVWYLGSGENHISLGFNTALIPPAEAPRTLDDLLDPKWKGKMSIVTSSTGVNWVGMALETKGREYVQRLTTQDIKLQSLSGAALAQLVVSGEVPLSPTIFTNNIYVAKEKGAPVEWRAIEPVITNLQSATITVKAPHPHAAALFLDYLHTRDGQEVMIRGGMDSPRPDMVPPEARFQKLYLQTKYPLDEYEKRFAEWERLLKQLAGRS
jgi:iron(III) transport system substrate-binding protein